MVLLNLGLGYLAYDISSDSHPERMDEVIRKIETGETEITKSLIQSQILNSKDYMIESDKLVVGLKTLVALMMLANIFLIAGIFWWVYMVIKRESIIN